MFTNLANHGVPSCTKVLFFTAWCWISRKKFFELRDKYGHHENLCYLASTCFLNWCICKQKQERKRRIDHWLANFQNPSTSWCVVPNLFHKDSKQSQTVAPLHGQLDVAYVVISHVEQQLQSLILHIYIYFIIFPSPGHCFEARNMIKYASACLIFQVYQNLCCRAGWEAAHCDQLWFAEIRGGPVLLSRSFFVVDPSANCEWCDHTKKIEKTVRFPSAPWISDGNCFMRIQAQQFWGVRPCLGSAFLLQILTSVADSFAHWTLRDLSTEWKLSSLSSSDEEIWS